MGAKTNEVVTVVEIPEIKIERFPITLVGDSPLIVHAWAEKEKKAIRDKQMKKAKAVREAKNPHLEFVNSMYWITDKPDESICNEEHEKELIDFIKKSRFGFKSIGFKAAAVDACIKGSDITKVAARGAFHIDGEFVEILGTPVMREDMVRIGMGTADLRYRGEFTEWKAIVTIRHNPSALSAAQIINIFNLAGFSVGVGEWRPQKDGSFGMFRVAS